MKAKLLIIYGYFLPVIGSTLVSILTLRSGFLSAEDVVRIFAQNRELVFAILAVFGSIAIPFQVQILAESNEHVLIVLKRSRVRQVFWTAAAVQAVMIIFMAVILLLLSSVKSNALLVGPLEIFAITLISFEFIAMVSNGRAYTEIREKIIAEVAMAARRR